ncbi:MAG: hypothetical protein U1F08_06490 [Steroidobacteraceae bacterium]
MPHRARTTILTAARAGGAGLVAGLLAAAPALPAGDDREAAAVTVTGSGPLVAKIEVERLERETLDGGATVREFVDARRLEVGEQIYYTIRVTNPGRVAVKDLVVTKRLPYGVEYVPGSAVGPDCRVDVSADGGRHYAPARRGTSAYTHVRWTCSGALAPGATSLLRFRAIFR